MKQIRFKIPELKDLPLDRQEAILQRCVSTEEFARKSQKIQRLCFASAVGAAIAVIYVLTWTGITGDRYWLSGVLAVATVAFFIVVMISAQVWFQICLVRKLVRREIANT
jgi:hypothetical protein